MTQFEKDFVLKCLYYFKLIISNPEEQQSAIDSYSGANPDNSRYHSNNTIPESECWLEQDKLSFSAAVFESTARANYNFLTQPELAVSVSLATADWRSNIVPLLSINTDPNDRIASIISNCSLIEERVRNETPSAVASSSSAEEDPLDSPTPAVSSASYLFSSPYPFFTAAGVAVVVAIGSTLALSRTR